MSLVEGHLEIYLGRWVKDKVTGLTGVVDTMHFDLFGCIQAGIDPGLDSEGKQKDFRYMDISRLEILKKKRVMENPFGKRENKVLTCLIDKGED